MHTKRGLRLYILTSLVCLFGFIVLAVLEKNSRLLTSCFLVLLLGVIIYAFQKKLKLHQYLMIAYPLFGFIHLTTKSLFFYDGSLYDVRLFTLIDLTQTFGSEFYVFKFDQLVQLVIFAIIALVLYEYLNRVTHETTSPILIFFFTIVAVMGIGATYGVVEFLRLVFLENTSIRDVYNVGLDLIANTVGATIGTIAAAYMERRKHNENT